MINGANLTFAKRASHKTWIVGKDRYSYLNATIGSTLIARRAGR